MKVGFTIKYGYNEIEIPVVGDAKPKYRPYGRKDKFTDKVTIYNYIVGDAVNAERYDRFVIKKCLAYNQITEGADGTIQRIINAQNVITKDVDHYKSPMEYAALPVDMKEHFFTVQVDDFVVLAEVDDVVTTEKDFNALKKKYRNNGFSVTAVSAYLNGENTNNIHIMHA